MSELDEQYIAWLCDQAIKNKDNALEIWLGWIKEHAAHLRRLSQCRQFETTEAKKEYCGGR